ncbi:MAG: ABC transporter permease [Acidobacteriaceae bacterium]
MPPIVDRPEYVREGELPASFGIAEQQLQIGVWLAHNSTARKALILALLALIWQVYGTWLGNSLLFPTFTNTVAAFFHGIANGELLRRSFASVRVLLQGYAAGLFLATALSLAAMSSAVGNDLLETLSAIMNPLPAIALLPLSLIWFGLGNGSIVFVVVHSVLWPVALTMHSGFRSISTTLRLVGQNYGLRGLPFLLRILMLAAFPSILAGLRIGWAFAWRTLIAAELVFGVSAGSGGLGWYIYENKNELQITNVFAGLFTVIIIGLIVEHLIFAPITRRTVRRWGMQI